MADEGVSSGVLQFRLLGPLEVARHGAQPIPLGERQRALLAVLLLHLNEVVSSDRLVEELAEDSSAEVSRNALQPNVSRLRRALDDGADDSILVTQAPGYLLRAQPDQVDALVFERLLAEGRAALD